MRNISAALTKDQIRESVKRVAAGLDPVKDVTRRHGWRNAKPGERLQVCEKCQGIKPGESLVRICVIELVTVRFEPLARMGDDEAYGWEELRREGFAQHPDILTPSHFIIFFCASHKGCRPETEVTRLEFKYIL